MLRLEIGGEKYILTYGKSIELFLVNGTADSLITAELSNWNGKAIKIPRIEVARGCGRFLGPELSNSKTASILHRTQPP